MWSMMLLKTSGPMCNFCWNFFGCDLAYMGRTWSWGACSISSDGISSTHVIIILSHKFWITSRRLLPSKSASSVLVRNSSSDKLRWKWKKVEEHMRVWRVWGRWLKLVCFALTNTSPQISEDRVPMISRGAKGQWKAEVTEEERRSLQEVFNAIFQLRSCPLSMQRLYTTTAGM